MTFAYKLGIVFFVLGCVVVLEWKRRDPSIPEWRCLLNLVGHSLVFFFALPQREVRSRTETLCIFGVLLCILALYYVADAWPYPISPLQFLLTSTATLLLCDQTLSF